MSATKGLDDLLQRLADGELADNVVQAAARGALPFPVQDLIRVQVLLARENPSEEVRALAAEALLQRDAQDTATVMAEEAVRGEVAAYFAALAESPAPVLEALAQNSSCPEKALHHLASRQEAGVLDRLLHNEVLLILYPDALAVLESNEALSAGQRQRLTEIRVHFVERPLPHGKPDAPALEPEVAQQVVEAMVAAEEYDRESAPAVSTPSAADRIPDAEEDAEDEKDKPVLFRILEMTTAEKIKLAFLGSKEERNILLRDSNRVVAASVLKSPRVNEKEVEAYANMRSLSEELIMMIFNKRDWIRNYQVMMGVLRHPKSPPRIILALLPRVQDRDLTLLSKDRNLPEMTRQQVRRNLQARAHRRRR
ncbi:MAG: hypothetical protein E2P04_02990 [Acidobacteria bacterium]|nr:MAG: hypothetical protein E2P04_02990 [Acidobacteriota bacterium]